MVNLEFSLSMTSGVIDPMIGVEGQVQGGVAQGIGQALLENAVYDGQGQLVLQLR